jgi:hypothetical protein
MKIKKESIKATSKNWIFWNEEPIKHHITGVSLWYRIVLVVASNSSQSFIINCFSPPMKIVDGGYTREATDIVLSFSYSFWYLKVVIIQDI